jgi:hypothetical protein
MASLSSRAVFTVIFCLFSLSEDETFPFHVPSYACLYRGFPTTYERPEDADLSFNDAFALRRLFECKFANPR